MGPNLRRAARYHNTSNAFSVDVPRGSRIHETTQGQALAPGDCK